MLCAVFKAAMVSIRRRKHLGLSPVKNAYLVQLGRFNENCNLAEHSTQNARSLTMRPIFTTNFSHQKQVLEPSLGSSNVSGCSSSKEHKPLNSGHEMKRRKRQRRKQFDNQEPCLMRGVYFKNMKWQAAIKVEKKQIHLGTVGSQEEAARLYDRAAFMCGREPNFELSEEEKQELSRFNWEEFLELTRNAITNKKHQKKIEAGMRKKQLTYVHASEKANAQAATMQAADAGVSNF